MSLEMVPGYNNSYSKDEIINQENSSLENNKEYNFEEFERLKIQIRSLVDKLKKLIENEEYNVFIGDDASGRISTLILKKITEKITGKEIKTLFIAGGRGNTWDKEKKENIETKLDTFLDFIKGRVLFITEFMGGGEGMARMAEELENKAIDFDIACVASNNPKQEYVDNFEVLKRHGLIIGYEEDIRGPAIYRDKHISGVFKEFSEDSQSKRISVNRKYGQQIKRSRNDVDLVVDEVIKEVWGKDEKKAA